MEKFLNRFSDKIADVMEPIADKLSSFVFVTALSQVMMVLMPVTIVGSFACLVANVDLLGWQAFVAAHPAIMLICFNLQSLTLTNITFYVIIVFPYLYASALKMKQTLAVTVVTIATYLLLAPHAMFTNIPCDWLGHKGMIPAILITVLVVRGTKYMLDHKMYIRMPAGVPKFIEDGFSMIVPAALFWVCAAIIEFFVEQTSLGCIYNIIYNVLQLPLQKIGLSYFGHVFTQVFATLLMFCGIHSGTVINIVTPLRSAAAVEQLAAYNAGVAAADLPYIICEGFTNISLIGAGGNCLVATLSVLFFCKAERYRSVAKVALVPGIFGVGEPILFGLPIMLNPTLFIPFIFTDFFNQTYTYILIATGIIGKVTGAQVSWTIPPILGPALVSTTPIRAIIAQLIMFAIDLLIWYPFIRSMDRTAVKEEQELAAQSGN